MPAASSASTPITWRGVRPATSCRLASTPGRTLGESRRISANLGESRQHARPHALDIGGNASQHASAAAADKDGVEGLAGTLLENLHPDGPLA